MIVIFRLLCLSSFIFAQTVIASCPPLGVAISTTSPTIIPADQSQIGIDDAGNAIAIWREHDGINTYIKSATLPKGGSWSLPVTISFIAGNDITAAPQIAVNKSNGNAVAVWGEDNAGSSTVRAAKLPFGGSWSIFPTPISSSSSPLFREPQVAINSSDYAVAVWVQLDGNIFIQSATLQFADLSWSPVIDVVTSDSTSPMVGVDSIGNAIAVWRSTSPSSSIQASTLSFGALAWTPFVQFAPDSSFPPQLAVHPSGYAVAVWSAFNGTDYIVASTFSAGTWSSVEILSDGITDARQPSVAIDQSKNAIVAWAQIGTGQIKSSSLPFGNISWSMPIDLSLPGTSFIPMVTFDSAGNAYAAWNRVDSGNFIIQFAYLLFGESAWSLPPCTLSLQEEDSLFPRIAAGPPGYAVINWNNTSMAVIQATEFSSVSPNRGSTSGGNLVRIVGVSNVTSVLFGPNIVTFTILSPTEISLVAPPHPLGLIDIIVDTSSGPIEFVNAYMYVNPICWQR